MIKLIFKWILLFYFNLFLVILQLAKIQRTKYADLQLDLQRTTS